MALGHSRVSSVWFGLSVVLTSRAEVAASSVTPLDDRRIVPVMKSCAVDAAASEIPLDDRR